MGLGFHRIQGWQVYLLSIQDQIWLFAVTKHNPCCMSQGVCQCKLSASYFGRCDTVIARSQGPHFSLCYGCGTHTSLHISVAASWWLQSGFGVCNQGFITPC